MFTTLVIHTVCTPEGGSAGPTDSAHDGRAGGGREGVLTSSR